MKKIFLGKSIIIPLTSLGLLALFFSCDNRKTRPVSNVKSDSLKLVKSKDTYDLREESLDSLDKVHELQKAEIENRIKQSCAKNSSEKMDTISVSSVEKEKIRAFIKTFYESMELSKNESEQAYISGAEFSKDNNKKLLSKTKSYSKQRVEKLTGNYHPYFNIFLDRIKYIYEKDTVIYCRTVVMYWIYETGTFTNEEEIQLSLENGAYNITNWYDIQPLSFDNGGPERAKVYGTESFGPSELYIILGNNLK